MKIEKFDGVYRFLSNFFPCAIEFEDLTYPSVEHAYQAAKTLDPKRRKAIAEAPSAASAKKTGKHVPLREDWEEVKLSIMEDLLRSKFFDDADLKASLIATGDAELIEGNWWGDTFWGVCKGEGENHLGKLLMKIRKELHD